MRFNLGAKLIISHLGMGIIPLLFISWTLLMTASEGLKTVGNQGVSAVEQTAYDQLSGMCQIKEKQIIYFFKEMSGKLSMVRNLPWLPDIFRAFHRAFTEGGNSTDSEEWHTLAGKYDQWFRDISLYFSWEDVFLINNNGYIAYSTNKASDLGMSLTREPLRSTSLGIAFDRLQATPDAGISFGDYAPYPPHNNEPSAFLMVRVEDEKGTVIGYLAIQPSTRALRDMIKMGSKKDQGLEAYLVGADGYMRSDSVLDPENYSREESFRQDNKVTTAAVRKALNGETGTGIIKDYRGETVLSSWRPVDIFGIRWALLCEFDKAAALKTGADMNSARAEADRRMKRKIMAVFLVTFCLVGTLAVLIVRSLSKPIVRAAGIADSIASGDFKQRLHMRRLDEIGQMADALDRMADRVAKNFRYKTGMAELADRMRGELDVRALAQNVVTYLARFLEAQMASLYLARQDETNRDEKTLVLTGSYAFHKRRSINSRIRIGEGLAGQAALENTLISVTELPEDYVRINSTLGDASPCNILAVPFSHENDLIGVVEFAAFREFSDEVMDFLNDVTENIAVAFRSAQNRQQVEDLLAETQLQSQELKQQSEELQATNEELESQTTALKEFQQELESRQEELQATNAELEEKSEALVAQKDKIRLRNQELMEAKERIEERSKDLALASKYKSEFLANMSHELRTPLNSLLLLAQSLAENRERTLSKKQQRSADIIVESGHDLLNLINEILDLARIEAGRVVTEMAEVRLADLAETARTLFRHMAEKKGLDFSITIADGLPPVIITDRKRVEQILKNFLGNSIKFTTEGWIDLTFARMKERAAGLSEKLEPEQTIAISVKDSGIGIPAEKQKAIFEAFQQADGSTARKYGGTGLGLSISRELAALLGGEIALVSEADKGSTFTLYLPVSSRENNEQMNEQVKKLNEKPENVKKIPPLPTLAGQTAEPARKNIPAQQNQLIQSIPDDRSQLTDKDKVMLIIEDDQRFAEVLLQQCHEADFKALVTACGEEGLQLAEEYRPDGIILDIRLPGIDGWTVLNSLKSNAATRHIPVHMMSAEEVSRKALHQGAIGFLTKPVSREQLGEAFDRFESVINRKIKKLLVVEDDDTLRAALVELVGNSDTKTFEAKTGREVRELLAVQQFDCMVLDLGLPDCNGIELLRQLTENETDGAASIPPVIIYTGRELTREEERELNRYSDSIIIKDARSKERLLDETSLFLHRMVESMPAQKQQIIADLYDRDKIFQGKKVLLVDDDMRNVYALSGILEQKGMEVIIAENGRSALKQLARGQGIDIVLMDIMMPEMDGYEAMQKIREQKKFWKLPVIALTAKAMKEDREKCIKAGASDYLAKPVDVDRLMSMMRVWLYR
ncbi:MAG: response regulator [Candidatus Electrothrix sp. YB6]